MTVFDWIPAVSTTSLFAIVIWLLRSVISTRLKASVHHEFDQKVEMLKTSFRKSEENFKSDLRLKEAQIEALRSGALTGLASRQAALDARRIVAVDQLWSAVQIIAPAKSVSATMAITKFDTAIKLSAAKPAAREMFATLGGNIDYQKFGSPDAEKARPYLSDMSWALYSAYQSILAVAMIKMQMLKSGIDIPDLIDKDRVQRLICVALPHQTEFVKNFDTGAYHYLLDELEVRLLDELRKILQGAEIDKSTIKQAAAILQESESLQASLSQTADAKKLTGDRLGDIFKNKDQIAEMISGLSKS